MSGADRYIDTNGIRLHYVEHQGSGPTFIITPGLTANARFFDALVDAGLAPRLNVLAVDLRGRGDSDKPDEGYSMADHAADMLGMMDQLGIERANFGGHSFGGLLTYYLAAHHPERIQRCVVIDAPAEVDETIVEQIQPSLDRLENTYPSWEAYLELVQSMPYYTDGWWDPHLEGFYKSDVEEAPAGGIRSRCRPAHIQQAVAGTLEHDWLSLAATMQQPTLLLRAPGPFGPAGYPPILPMDKAERTVGAMPNGRMMDLHGNHITSLFGDSARLAADAIVEFILEGAQ
ncbi:MAG: alpha/beta hydrolase [bacterium]|nr:alpha/beta hydrolase [bacterium]